MIGKRLGPYEITAKLGEGGMGEVWRATDTKLRRDVAIKVLPAAFTEDRERLARFEREAQMLAQLHHPNIASIFGLEESDGVRALAMELVEGPTLADRLESGGLSLDESLSIARQIAEALEEAHEKGIIHRDLKPQNVKASIEGKVKVLDFGLAKAMDPASGSSSVADLARSPTIMNSPTLTAAGTQLGVILGTAAYMSPEQARGQGVDKRADIWAFGVVLYEMLVGGSLFAGDTVSDTLAGVLKSEIDLGRLPESTPPAIRRLLRRCLERRPKNRLHDIADARLVLMDLEAGVVDDPQSAPAPVARSRRREVLAWVVAGLAALTAGALFLGREAPSAGAAPRVIRATLPLPPGLTIELDGERAGMPALSPNGRRVAFGARQGSGPTHIWVQDLETAAVRPLPGTEEGYRPFWSPDGRKIGYFTWGHLMTTPSEGGPVTRLAPARDARGGSWSPNGTIVFAPYASGPLLAVSEQGGEPRPATAWSERLGGGTHRFPQFLPDGEHFLYLERPARFGSRDDSGVDIGRLGSTERVARLLDANTNAVYADRQLLFVRDGALVAQPFDADRRALAGAPTVLVSDLLVNRRFTYGVFSASEAGLVAFLTGKQSDLSQLVWRDRAGRRLGALGTPAILSGFGGLALSGDGRWVAFSRIEEGGVEADIWIIDLARGNETRLSRPESDDFDPIFAPDGGSMYYGSAGVNGSKIIRRDLSRGSELDFFVSSDQTDVAPMSVTPDGAWLACDRRHFSLQSDLLLLPTAAGGEPRVLVETPEDEAYGQISPDGRWFLWSSDESGRYEVFVAPFPGMAGRVQVSRSGGTQPRWGRDGHELYFKTPDNVLTALPIETGSGTVAVGSPEPLFAITEFYGWTYAISADGERFLVREPLAEREASPITLLTGWTALLEERR